jgi:hypothetical protein
VLFIVCCYRCFGPQLFFVVIVSVVLHSIALSLSLSVSRTFESHFVILFMVFETHGLYILYVSDRMSGFFCVYISRF